MVDSQDIAVAVDAAFSREDFVVPEFSKQARIKLAVAMVLSLVPIVLYIVFLVVLLVVALYLAVRFFPDLIESPNSFFITLYVITLAVFLTVFFSLMRPIFFRPVDTVLKTSLSEEEPALYAFVNTFSALMSVDAVQRVQVSMDVALDVSYPTWRSLRDGRLTLKLGLPLIATLSLNEFAALLVHQLAPYQNADIKTRFSLIRGIRAWLYGAVHNEDAFTSWLDKWSEKSALLGKLLAPARLGTAVVNQLFQGGLNVVEVVSGGAVEQVQFYADEMQAQVCGSAYFDVLLKRLVAVDQAYHGVSEAALSEAYLPPNFADAIAEKCMQSTAPGDQFIEMARSDYFDNWHMLPPPNVRTRRIAQFDYAPRQPFQGVLKELFSDVSSLGAELTLLFYQKHQLSFNRQSEPQKIIAKGPHCIALPKEDAVLKRITSGLFRRDIVWEFPQADKFSHVPEEKITPFLNKLVVSIRHSLPDLNRYKELVDDYDKYMARLHLAKWLIKDGSRQRPTAEEVAELHSYKKDFEKAFSGKREFYRKSYGVRVAAAVALGKSSKAYGSAIKLIQFMSRLAMIQDSVYETKTKGATLASLLARQAAGDTVHQNTISRLTRMVLKQVADIEKVLDGLPCNFLPEGLDVDENRLDLECLNGADYERQVLERFQELVNYYEAYNTVMSAKLGQFVEMVERKKGIESVVIAAARQGTAPKADNA